MRVSVSTYRATIAARSSGVRCFAIGQHSPGPATRVAHHHESAARAYAWSVSARSTPSAGEKWFMRSVAAPRRSPAAHSASAFRRRSSSVGQAREPETAPWWVMGASGDDGRPRDRLRRSMRRGALRERAEGDAIVPTVATLDRHRAPETVEHPSLQAPVPHGAHRSRARLCVLARRQPPPRLRVRPALSCVTATFGHRSPLPFGLRG